MPFEAALVVAVAYGYHLWRSRKRSSIDLRPGSQSLSPSWGLLYLAVLVALLSHILLDYTNNYGVRPFSPFNTKWYAASIVFIFDPVLFLLLLGGLLLPVLFGLIGQEISGERRLVPGAAWSRAALITIVLVWGVRAFQHDLALRLAMTQTVRAPATAASDFVPDASDQEAPQVSISRSLLQPRRAIASPDPVNPFRWYTATDFGVVYLLAAADTRHNTIIPSAVLEQPAPGRALVRAEQSHLGRVYRDWSPMPWIHLAPTSSQQGQSDQVVLFQDVRFMGTPAWLPKHDLSPLTGEVDLSPAGQVVLEGMDGKFGR